LVNILFSVEVVFGLCFVKFCDLGGGGLNPPRLPPTSMPLVPSIALDMQHFTVTAGEMLWCSVDKGDSHRASWSYSLGSKHGPLSRSTH
jgi:hypothetical protein